MSELAIVKKLQSEVPNPKQLQFFRSRASRTGYGGARGGGKSWAVRRKLTLLCMEYPGLRCLLLRRTIPELRENHILPLRAELQGLAKYNDDEKSFTFPNGSRLKCGYCENEADVFQYQGQEYDVIALEEATAFTEFQMQFLTTCNRSVRDDFTPRMYFSGNPGGVGHAWFKRLFIDRDFTETENPDDYVFIPAKVYDNTILMKNNPQYVKNLENLPKGMREAHLEGRWDCFVGQYFDEWNPEIHVIKPFDIPKTWYRYFIMDYGLDMLAGLWAAMSPQGRAYGYKELYESNLRVTRAAARIKQVEADDKIYERLAPPDLFAKTDQTGRSTIELFSDEGLYFGRTKNDRIPGWYDMKEWLAPFEHEHSTPEKPIWTANLVFFDTCKNFIKNIPLMQHDEKLDPNDCAKEPHAITHAPDCVRYFVTGRPIATPVGSTEQPVVWEDDQYEDYDAADEKLRKYLLKTWGNPFAGGLRRGH
jgi:phage terminase large subunit